MTSSSTVSCSEFLKECETEAERFAVALAFYAGLLVEPDRVDVFPELLRVRKKGTNKSDTLYYIRHEGFKVVYPLWHRRWSSPGIGLLRRAKAAGKAHRGTGRE